MTLTVASIFSGIGGIELGLEKAGYKTIYQCEILETARSVLNKNFDVDKLDTDITEIKSIPPTDIVAAGFPCQDLSQAGNKVGIRGHNSSLVDNMFDLILKNKKQSPQWIMLENVPFMLQLHRGRAMKHLAHRFDTLGMKWAYRVVDARAFGLPQRRRRVIVLASREHDPCDVLFSDESEYQTCFEGPAEAYGFYWTEGNTGLGWTVDGVPTLKGGSGLGIPCPPAIWLKKNNEIVTPHIQDAERLQGFPAKWTQPVEEYSTSNSRWKLVGNAVAVPIAKWVGTCLQKNKGFNHRTSFELSKNTKWPNAGWGYKDKSYGVEISEWPKCYT